MSNKWCVWFILFQCLLLLLNPQQSSLITVIHSQSLSSSIFASPCPINYYNSLQTNTTTSSSSLSSIRCVPISSHPLYMKSCELSLDFSENSIMVKDPCQALDPPSVPLLQCYVHRCVPCIPNSMEATSGLYCKANLWNTNDDEKDDLIEFKQISYYMGWEYLDRILLLWIIFLGLLVLYFVVYMVVNYNKYSHREFKRQYELYIYDFIVKKIHEY
ncbi:hypothetical protein C9374_006245 [Naegleria lovaniensis]|uniref:Uncharacterized protein n=1 Tax=Naegleria lovaniensis TaxID=51637 RepID=A0AA88GHW1_NAELO|nr:uncharacterized protein C9374_006245 [Naegleria lovaniensis]KAG2381256.1 hypothetical protein C9374_006245 [Naegleria lovaniensis]